MPTTDYPVRVGASAVFSGDWLRYRPTSGPDRYYAGYTGVLLGWWNGSPEFTIDRDAAALLAATFDETAEYVRGDWRTIAFDGHLLTVRRPQSLGGGVHLATPAHGRYRIGWGLPWYPVPATACDRLDTRT